MLAVKIRTRTTFKPRNVMSRFERAERRFLFRVGGRWKMVAAARVRDRGPESSKPGRAPNSHKGHLKRGFRYQIIGNRVIGGVVFRPSANRTGPRKIAKYLEKGGRTPDGKRYYKRPILAPPLRKIEGDFPRIYADSMRTTT